MKFAQKISSRRRSIWKACSSCSPRLGVDVRRLGRELRARRVDRLAARLEQRGHRRLREPVHLEARDEPAQLARDRDVAPGVAEADRRARRAAPAAAADAPARQRAAPAAAGAKRSANSWIRRLTSTGWRAMRDVAGAGERDVLGAGQLGEREAALDGWQLSRSPWTTSTGQRTRAAQLLDLLARRGRRLSSITSTSRPGRRARRRRRPRRAWSSAAPGTSRRRRTRGSRAWSLRM